MDVLGEDGRHVYVMHSLYLSYKGTAGLDTRFIRTFFGPVPSGFIQGEEGDAAEHDAREQTWARWGLGQECSRHPMQRCAAWITYARKTLPWNQWTCPTG